MLSLPTGRAVDRGALPKGTVAVYAADAWSLGRHGLENLRRQPGYMQPDYVSGHATPGARVSSGVVINKFFELPRGTVAAYAADAWSLCPYKQPLYPWGALEIYL